MSHEDICSLPIKDIANKDAVLFLWATSPKLKEAMEVLDAWAFDFKSTAVWYKSRMIMGYYFRAQHELLLIATRGKGIPVPEGSNRVSSVIVAPQRAHSEKPDELYKILETMYPEYEKVELFARKKREGWDAWGNQVA